MPKCIVHNTGHNKPDGHESDRRFAVRGNVNHLRGGSGMSGPRRRLWRVDKMAGLRMSAMDRAATPGIGGREAGSADRAGVLVSDRPAASCAPRKGEV